MTSNSPLLNSYFAGIDFSQAAISLRPSLPDSITSRTLPLRLVAGSESTAKELFFVPFEVTRAGRKEIALSSRSILPIEIELTIRNPPGGGATAAFRPVVAGADIQQLDKVLQFLDELGRSGTSEIFNAETNECLMKMDDRTFSPGSPLPWWVRSMVTDAAVVCRTLRIQLSFPARVTQNDAFELHRLALIVTGGEFFHADLNTRVVLTKKSRILILENIEGREFPIRAEFPAGTLKLEALGRIIDPGRVCLIAERASFTDPSSLREFCNNARDGDTLDVPVHCAGPCHWERSIETLDVASAFTIA